MYFRRDNIFPLVFGPYTPSTDRPYINRNRFIAFAVFGRNTHQFKLTAPFINHLKK
ncbi:hypothetical protein BACIH_0403 [Bacillus amyloliquefaciens]|nr:hypothetical protein U471_04280 [Bacillus amyloliquefaciens CC178]QEY92193.1 hypothetical protein BACIH_0403 [Bacillus amyloliquefaciens]